MTKPHGLGTYICGLLLLVFAAASAASAQDDKQKLMDIEKAFAAQATNGPEAANVAKKYLYDGNVLQLTGTGRIGIMTKAQVVDLMGKPDPSDPAVKSTQTVSDFRIEIDGDTALVGYKMTNTDTGHKDATLNATVKYGCLDTFVKKGGQWYSLAGACSRTEPISKTEYDAILKARKTEPKEVQQAYH